MTDARPERVYGVLVREGRAFLSSSSGLLGLPGGVFRPMAEDRKVELKAHLWDQLTIKARAVWAQGAFDYQGPAEDRPFFSGFYTIWEWDGDPPPGAGVWVTLADLARVPLDPSLKILLTSVLNTQAVRTR